MKIGVNCGHTINGQASSGAIGYINESDETRAVGYKLMEYLRNAGHTVYDCTNDIASSVKSNLYNICLLANAQQLDLFISIHFNAGGGWGCESYTYGAKQYEEALRINKNLNKIGFKNRGVKDGSNLYVIKNTKAKSILVEVCFVDTQSDADLYMDNGAEAVALAIAEAINNNKINTVDNEQIRSDSEMIYNYIDGNMPEWARPTIQKLVDKGYLKGNEKGELGLNDTMLKVFVINDRAGLYDK